MSILLISFHLYAEVEEECPDVVALPEGTKQLISTMETVSRGLYKDVMNLKVNLDGEGQLSIFFENGQPKILKFTYKNKSGTTVEQITFDDLAQGKALEYENPSIPGKAIVVEKGATFKSGDLFNFKLSFRSGVKPPKYDSHQIELKAKAEPPAVAVNNKNFTQLTLSPGVSFFSWDGTFKKVEFK